MYCFISHQYQWKGWTKHSYLTDIQLHPGKWIVKKFDNIFSDVVVTTNVQSNVANTAIMCRHNGELDNKASSSSNWQKSQGICFDKPATINISTIFTLFWLRILPQSNLSYLLNAERIQKAIDLERFAIRLPCLFFVSFFYFLHTIKYLAASAVCRWLNLC